MHWQNCVLRPFSIYCINNLRREAIYIYNLSRLISKVPETSLKTELLFLIC